MKNLFGWMLVVLLVLTAGVSCSDDEELLAGNGIADAAWSAENQVEIEGGVLNYTFAAAGDWTARSSADWCEVQTGSGMAGRAGGAAASRRCLKSPIGLGCSDK